MRTMEAHMPCHGTRGEVEERIRSLPMDLLSQRGRIGLETTFPYLITNANGTVCNFFGRNSTELIGRSLRLLSDGTDCSHHALFEAASVAAKDGRVRTYLTITGAQNCKHERMIIAFSLGKASNGCPLIEMLIFPMDSQNPFEIRTPMMQIISKDDEVEQCQHKRIWKAATTDLRRNCPDREVVITSSNNQEVGLSLALTNGIETSPVPKQC
ncbi:hypothetical protein GUITHDRAFT_106383 [Guillardia theta CCMP2712]|uniref:Uncharacterized protein n=1 Tax=Guillardia theta (strain CCMP2712) TaxID=905079 RepID=L1JIC5_GUITC|nr:hypothetical protein GUITHDRAFT_106383 [Guillardia theta CCMP2712]EKX47835.1 hypothetical protein GUITHDRAFT_106383 [Guillardia theta CCMP2712]|eukprot:XP_005834815.1 hypothetical protein GUITHDRAFT_106383 [Guillardia theta CCMP2712]